MAEIYLIGTYHFDPNGPSRLKRTLEEIGPQLILLEGNELKDKGRQIYKRLVKSELELKKADRNLIEAVSEKGKTLGYEYEIALQFASLHQTSLDYFNDVVDYPNMHQNKVEARGYVRSLIKHKITARKILSEIKDAERSSNQKWNSLKLVEETEKEKIFAYPDSSNGFSVAFNPKRDIIMKKVLRDHDSSNRYNRIATITGFSHIVRDPDRRTLYSKIEDLHPTRKFLYA